MKCCGHEDARIRHAEPIALTKENVSGEKQKPQQKEEWGLEQKRAVNNGQISVDSSEQDGAEAMARIETNPRLYDCSFGFLTEPNLK
jgi:hypothetical protein